MMYLWPSVHHDFVNIDLTTVAQKDSSTVEPIACKERGCNVIHAERSPCNCNGYSLLVPMNLPHMFEP